MEVISFSDEENETLLLMELRRVFADQRGHVVLAPRLPQPCGWG